jgi:hypothetical protein
MAPRLTEVQTESDYGVEAEGLLSVDLSRDSHGQKSAVVHPGSVPTNPQLLAELPADMIGDHNNPHLTAAERRRDSSVAADATLVVAAFLLSAGLVIALIVALVVWGTK